MRRIIVGISGASGAIYGIRLLEVLNKMSDIEIHLVLSEPAMRTILYETDYKDIEKVKALANYNYSIDDIGAKISSGSFKTEGMIIIPCSVKTLSGIANSFNENLLVRASDVILKERRRLVLVFRETPLHIGHIKLMERVMGNGGIILPPMPSFYNKPNTIDDIINQTIGKVLDLFDIEHELFCRWEGDKK